MISLPGVNMNTSFTDFGERPFLKWIGGKQKHVNKLISLLPQGEIDFYVEPFLGAGSIFQRLDPNEAILSDLNPHLIQMYDAVRNDPAGVFEALQIHDRSDSEKHYYEVRESFNLGLSITEGASAFIYMNRVGFNGVYRVNRKGEFNVPYGKHTSKFLLPDLNSLVRMSRKIEHARLMCQDFGESIRSAPARSIIYCDPPYAPINDMRLGEYLSFTKYTHDSFSMDDQIRLRNELEDAVGKGCKVLITNSDTPQIREIYENWILIDLTLSRSVNRKSKRLHVGELAITNFSPEIT
jgi:DNA adenine methylase